MHQPIALTTIGDLRAAGYSLTAVCRACNRTRRLELDDLCQRLGEDHPYVGDPCPLPLRCACGSRDVGVLVAARGR